MDFFFFWKRSTIYKTYPRFLKQGLSLFLDWNVSLRYFNWKKLALTDFKYISAFVLFVDAHL